MATKNNPAKAAKPSSKPKKGKAPRNFLDDMPAYVPPLPQAFLDDLAALAAYEPRRQALAWIRSGEIDKYLDWSEKDDHVAAWGEPEAPGDAESRFRRLFSRMSLDLALLNRGLDYSWPEDYPRQWLAAQVALEAFFMSPFDFALREVDDTGFDAIMAVCASPECRRACSGEQPSSAAAYIYWRASYFSRRDSSLFAAIIALSRTGHSALASALLEGRFDRAEKMIRAGLAPNKRMADFESALALLLDENAVWLSAVFGSPVNRDRVEAALAWARKRGDRSDDIHERDGRRGL